MTTLLLSRATVANIYNPQNLSKDELIEGFVVRQQLFKKLYKAIKEAKMETPEQHYLILGRRGMGKTTLLLRLAYEIENDPDLDGWLIPLVFNEEEYGIRGLFKFWERVMGLLEEKHPAFRFETAEIRRLSKENPDHDAYEKALFEWVSSELTRHGKKLILFVDNFGDMARKLSDAEAHRLRKILQTSADIRIFAASSVVLEAFYKYDHPFYEFFKQVELEGLNEKETRELLLSLSRHYKKDEVQRIVEQNPGRVEALRRITSGVIRSVVLLFEIFADDQDGSAFHDLQIILDRTSPLYKHRMDDLSDQQQAIVEAIALNWDAISVKEIAEQTRLESKVVSAQLNNLEKNGIVEKRATRTKNHLYLIAERFFNIWFLMRLGRKADQKRVLWLVRFFEEWCDKDLIKNRSERHIEALRKGKFDPEAAFYVTQAMAAVKDLDHVSRHKLLEETKFYLSEMDTELAKSLSQSDLDLAWQAIEKWYAGKREEAVNLLKSARPFTGSKMEDLLKQTPDFQNMDESVSQRWQEAMDDFACDIGVIYIEELQNKEIAFKCFEYAARSNNPKALFNLGAYFEKEEEDSEKAQSLFEKAINAGLSELLAEIGDVFQLFKSKAAKSWYKKAAEKGHSRAMNIIGILYHDEHKDLIKAEEWYRKAASKGDLYAMNNLGWIFQYEYTDLKKAEEWYEKAAKKGHSGAMTNLALLYENEHKDLQKAEKWYEKAAKKGNSTAMYNLALLYKNEHKDLQKAEEWYLKSAKKGHSEAMFNLGWLYQNEHKNLQKAEEWYLKAAEKGDSAAMNNLALLYENERKDLQKAEQWYLKSAEKGEPIAMRNLGYLYKTEHKDLQKAEEWYLKAAEKGDSDAMSKLGWLYEDEHKDLQKAEEWCLKAAKKGHSGAMGNLGWLYEIEHKDLQKAEEWYKKAAKKGHSGAMNNLALLYENEHKDLQKAEQWYLKSAEKGEPIAMNNLGRLYKNEHKDLQKAEEWYLKAAEKGESYAMHNLGWLYQTQHKDFQKAEEWYLKAADLGNIGGLNGLAWMLFQQKKEKEKALDMSAKAFQKEPGNAYVAHTYACILIWHNQMKEALEVAANFLWDREAQEAFKDDFILFLTLLLAKNQQQALYDLFASPQGEEQNFKDRFKPIWYAILKKLDHPDFLRMGDELKQTVDEILAKAEQLAEEYK